MSVKLDTRVLAALDMIAGVRRKATGKSPSMSDVVWMLVEKTYPNLAEIIDTVPDPDEDEDESDGK